MKRVELAEQLPGCCFFCRSNNREWYIDTTVNIDMEDAPHDKPFGAIYICDQCVILMGHIATMITPEEALALQLSCTNLENENFDLRVKVSGLEQAIDGLRLAGGVSRPDPHPTPSMVVDETPQESREGEGSVGTGEVESSESVHDEGMVNIPTDGESSAFKLSL